MNTILRFIYLLLFFTPVMVMASDVSLPHNFESGKKAVAAEVNANFTAVKSAVDDNNSRVTALETLVNTLSNELTQARQDITQLTSALSAAHINITALQNQMFEMNARMLEVEHNSIAELSDYLSVDTVSDPRGPLVRLTGANLQLVNGVGYTYSANGLGNLIIGYDETRSDSNYFCADGSYYDEPTCTGAGQVWAISHKSGSHNIVLGAENNYSRFGGLVTGQLNTINGEFATIAGGWNNQSSGYASSVSGGVLNQARGDNSSVSGGSQNKALNGGDSISGGYLNIALGGFSSISGGGSNEAHGYLSSVSGGAANEAYDDATSILGGVSRITAGQYATIPPIP